MAFRPVFMAMATRPFVEKFDTEFKYYSGFSVTQARKSIESLHTAFISTHPKHAGRVLEISSNSASDLGVCLSAFNLLYRMRDGSRHTVETVFQAGKCFENGKQYMDLLNGSSYDAKKDERLRSSGSIVGFKVDDIEFPTKPITYFYDWLYVNAVYQNPTFAKQLTCYSAFTDIAFNPQKSWNCQARSAAVYVGLWNSGRLTEALSSPRAFLEVVYDVRPQVKSEEQRQMELWDYL